MNNCEKLLRAFIEAQGYDVEVTEDIKRFYLAEDISISGDLKENATPESVFNIVDYKVTKKKDKVSYACSKCGTHIAYGNSLTSCLCKSTKNLIMVK